MWLCSISKAVRGEGGERRGGGGGGVFFFNDTATTESYTLSLHDALPIFWPLGMATIHAHAGDKDEAFRWLEQHQKIEHNPNFGGYTHSLLQGLHSDPRWQQFLESQGVSDAQLAVIDFKPTFPN